MPVSITAIIFDKYFDIYCEWNLGNFLKKWANPGLLCTYFRLFVQ